MSKSTSDQSIIGESAVCSLKYNILKKVSVPLPGDDKIESHGNQFAKYFGISEKQTLVALMRANAELQQWDVVEQLLVVKVLFCILSVFINSWHGYALGSLLFVRRSKSETNSLLQGKPKSSSPLNSCC